MRHPHARGISIALAAVIAAAACSRSDPDPPIIPLPGQGATSPLNEDPKPPSAPLPPIPKAKPTASSSAKPQASAAPIASTPYMIPWPAALPAVPGIVPPLFPTPAATSQDAEAERVIVYGTTTCPACKSLKQHLGARGIRFVFVNLEDPAALATPAGAHVTEVPREMRNAIPVTRVARKDGNVTWVQGDDPDRIEKAHKAS